MYDLNGVIVIIFNYTRAYACCCIFFFFFEKPNQNLAQQKLTLLKEHQKKEGEQYCMVHLRAKHLGSKNFLLF